MKTLLLTIALSAPVSIQQIKAVKLIDGRLIKKSEIQSLVMENHKVESIETKDFENIDSTEIKLIINDFRALDFGDRSGGG